MAGVVEVVSSWVLKMRVLLLLLLEHPSIRDVLLYSHMRDEK